MSSLGQEEESYLKGLEAALNGKMEVREFQKRARPGEKHECGHSGLEVSLRTLWKKSSRQVVMGSGAQGQLWDGGGRISCK